MIIALVCAFAVALIGGPVVAAQMGHPLGAAATIGMTALGVLLLLGAGALVTYQRLYHKTRGQRGLRADRPRRCDGDP
ncbi:MAG: hypothetical protein M5U28_55915 [Sandaracinaceae bacterium]|nr:hypothetical protein [Sandaracinaceae bacterium]